MKVGHFLRQTAQVELCRKCTNSFYLLLISNAGTSQLINGSAWNLSSRDISRENERGMVVVSCVPSTINEAEDRGNRDFFNTYKLIDDSSYALIAVAM